MLLEWVQSHLARLLLYWSVWVYYDQVWVHNIPAFRPGTRVIYALNHPNGVFDFSVLALAAPKGKFPCVLAKRSLFIVPFVGWFLRLTNAVPVVREMDNPISDLTIASQRRRNLFTEVLSRLRAGCSIAICPEGTSHDDELQIHPLKSGIASIAFEAKKEGIRCVVQPVFVRYLDGKVLWRGRVLVDFGAPVEIPCGVGKEGLLAMIKRELELLSKRDCEVDNCFQLLPRNPRLPFPLDTLSPVLFWMINGVPFAVGEIASSWYRQQVVRTSNENGQFGYEAQDVVASVRLVSHTTFCTLFFAALSWGSAVRFDGWVHRMVHFLVVFGVMVEVTKMTIPLFKIN